MPPKIISLSAVRKNAYDTVKEREENIIGLRIQEARTSRGLSLEELSTLLAENGLTIKRQGIGKWESGVSVPNAYQLLALCDALRIEEGIAFFTGKRESFGELDDVGLRKLEEYRKDLIASGRYKRHKAERNSIIDYIDMRVTLLGASAGTGAFLDEELFETMRFPANTVPVNADFGIRVQGDSMEPVYHDGQIVWVQQCETLRPGEVGIFILDGEGFIKLYDEKEPDEDNIDAFIGSDGVLHPQPVLISYNENYEPRCVSPNSMFSIAGRVLN